MLVVTFIGRIGSICIKFVMACKYLPWRGWATGVELGKTGHRQECILVGNRAKLVVMAVLDDI